MKKLLLTMMMILLAGIAIPQELALAYPMESKAKSPANEEPVASYWMTQDLSPLNYLVVSQSITYDTRALESGLEGTVVVQIQIDEDGNYFRHRIVNEAHPLLVQAVEEKIPYLKFPQPEFQGEPVSALVTVPFRFRLTDGW